MRSRNSPTWFGFVFLPSSRSWPSSGKKLTGLESRNDLMNVCSRPQVPLIQPERFGENRVTNSGILESVKAVLVSPWELRVRTELDAPPTRQKYITNQMLDQHGRTPLCTRCSWGPRSHSSDCRARFEAIWTKELAEAEVPIRAVDAVPLGPNVRVSEPVEPAGAAGGQPAAMEVNTDPVVEKAGGAAPQPDVSQAQQMEVLLEQCPYPPWRVRILPCLDCILKRTHP